MKGHWYVHVPSIELFETFRFEVDAVQRILNLEDSGISMDGSEYGIMSPVGDAKRARQQRKFIEFNRVMDAQRQEKKP